jgi:glycosyltransferase involved in cell wall biosynthesis
MADRPLVSIILPVYNGEQTLQATMDSLLSQTFTDFELVIGIDGSTDGSKSIVESYGDARIRLIEHPKNLGLANNVNALIASLHPDSLYIAMAEQDDVYVADRLALQIEVMEANAEVGLVSGIAEFNGVGGKVLFPGILVHGEKFPQGVALFQYLYEHQLKVVNTCMMIRRKAHEIHGLRFRNSYGNFNVDWDYVLRFSLMSQVFGIPKVLVRMDRGLVNNSVTRDKVAQYQASRQLLKDFREEFPELVTVGLYRKALKQHRKIELGHHSPIGIVFRSLYYSVVYMDLYFIRYLMKRTKMFFYD